MNFGSFLDGAEPTTTDQTAEGTDEPPVAIEAAPGCRVSGLDQSFGGQNCGVFDHGQLEAGHGLGIPGLAERLELVRLEFNKMPGWFPELTDQPEDKAVWRRHLETPKPHLPKLANSPQLSQAPNREEELDQRRAGQIEILKMRPHPFGRGIDLDVIVASVVWIAQKAIR